MHRVAPPWGPLGPRSVLLFLALGTLAAGCAHVPTYPGEDRWQRNMMFLYGQRFLQESEDWEPVEDQQAIGVTFDLYDPAAWYLEDRDIGYEIGLQHAWDDGNVAGVDVEAETTEIFAGGRLTFHYLKKRLHPYIGTGLTYLRAEADSESTLPSGFSGSDDDSSFGLYVHGGLYYSLTKAFFVGLDYRWVLFTSVDVGIDTDVDYQQLGLMIGFGF